MTSPEPVPFPPATGTPLDANARPLALEQGEAKVHDPRHHEARGDQHHRKQNRQHDGGQLPGFGGCCIALGGTRVAESAFLCSLSRRLRQNLRPPREVGIRDNRKKTGPMVEKTDFREFLT